MSLTGTIAMPDSEAVAQVFHWLGTASCMGLFGVSVWASYAAYGSVWTPFVLAALSLVLLIISVYGSFAMRKDLASSKHLYVYAGLLLACEFGILATGALGLAAIKTAEQYIQQHWYQVQNVVIPFTTQLDTRRLVGTNLTWCFWLALITVACFWADLVRVWSRPGGRAGTRKQRALVPTVCLVTLFSIVSAVSALEAVPETEFATEHNGTALLVLGASSLAVLCSLYVSVAAVFVWGYAPAACTLSATLPLPFAASGLIAAITVMARSADVGPYVARHWETRTRLVVPREYQATPASYYAVDAAAALAEAGILGFVMALAVCVHCFVAGSAALTLRQPPLVRRTHGRRRKHGAGAASGGEEVAAAGAAAGGGGGKYGATTEGAVGSESKPIAVPAAAGVASARASDASVIGSPVTGQAGLHMRPRSTDDRGGIADDAIGGAAGEGGAGKLAGGGADGDGDGDAAADEAVVVGAAGGGKATAKSSLLRGASGGAAGGGVRKGAAGDEEPVPRQVPLWQTVAVSLKRNRGCAIISAMLVAGVAAGVGFGLYEVGDASHCGALVTSPQLFHSNTSIEATNLFFLNVNVSNSFAHGYTYVVFGNDRSFTNTSVSLDIVGINGQMSHVATDAAAILRKGVTYNSTSNTVEVHIHPPDLDASELACLGANLVVTIPFNGFAVSATVNSAHTLVNMSSPGQNFPKWGAVTANTTDGTIFLEGILAFKAVNVGSVTGDILMDGVLSPGIGAWTGGDIRALNATSIDFTTKTIYDIEFRTRGSGRLIISDVFGGYNATLSTEDGDMLGVVAAGGTEQDLNITTVTGDVYLNNFILALGTKFRIVSQSGDIHVAAITCNELFVTTDSGDVSLTEIFIGLTEPDNSPVSYPVPKLDVRTNSGDITGLGLGGSPAGSFAPILQMYGHTELGNIKFEVNGGGFEGRFSARAGNELEVSKDGSETTANGTVGYGNGFIDVSSTRGSVELAMLPGPF